MTSKDLLRAMQQLGVTYTDEADARAARHAAGGGRKPLLPALTVLCSAALCIAVLAGVMHIGSAGEQMQSFRQDISAQLEQETMPAETTVTAAPEQTASEQAETAAQVSAQTDAAKEAVPQSADDTVPSAPVQIHVPVQTDAQEQTKETALCTESAAKAPAGTETRTEPENIYNRETMVVEQVSGHAGEIVPVSLYVFNNPGFNFGVIELYFDPSLTVCTDSDDFEDITFDMREIPAERMELCHQRYSDDESGVIYLFIMDNMEDWHNNKVKRDYENWSFIEGDGWLVTYYFEIPADAESGTVYDIDLISSGWHIKSGGTYDFKPVNGSITVL